MNKQLVAIWFPYLLTDWMVRRQPELRGIPFALALNERGRRVVKAVNGIAKKKGALVNMVVADCKAFVPELQVFDSDLERPKKLITAMAEWCIRFTPHVSVDGSDGLILDASGCTHLWGGDAGYLEAINDCFKKFGYTIKTAMAETVGTAWAVCHYGKSGSIVTLNDQKNVLSVLPPSALRLESLALERLAKLGFKTTGSFMDIPKTALRRRFGQALLTRLAQAQGEVMELTDPIRPIAPYIEHLPCLEAIRTAVGIETGLKALLERLCERMNKESKGLRSCELRCYRIDGDVQKLTIGTNKPTRHVAHLFKLFELKITSLTPDLGFELFSLEAPVVEELTATQDALWSASASNEADIAELVDKISGKLGAQAIHRYLPAEHYWPERAVKEAASLNEKATTNWRTDLPRPLHVLPVPERIEVSVPIPDYPPLLFKYKGAIHTVKKSDGPERIEQEWWLQNGLYRDYYCVEDTQGCRYWLFRAGDYDKDDVKWFLHGFFP